MNTASVVDDTELNSLADRIAQTAALIDSALHQFLTDVRRFDEAELWHRQGALSCAHWLSWRVGLDLGAAREKVRVAHALATLPLIDEALKHGEVSYSKVRAMSRVATPANEATLLDLAQSSTASQLEKICRLYRRTQAEPEAETRDDRRWMRLRETDDGMVRLEFQLTADEAALVVRACEISAETLEHDRVLGLVAMAEATLRAGGANEPASGHPPVEVVVHVEADTLVGHLDDGQALSPETCRRLLCDAGVVPVLEKADGTPLDVGRKTRSIPTALRRALNLRDGGCTFPGCTHKRWLDGHHILHWGNGGETSLENTLLLCRPHHRLLHEGGFAVATSDHNSRRCFLFPDGTEVPATGIRRRLAPSDIGVVATSWDSEVAYPRWDGEPVDYDAVVDALVAYPQHSAPA